MPQPPAEETRAAESISGRETPAPAGSRKTLERAAAWAGPALCAALFVRQAARSWLRWPDPIIDAGRELYVPWRIGEGALPYRDIELLFGPFSALFNGALFNLFGAHILTLVFTNLTLAAVFSILIYRIFLTASGRLTATACTLIYIGLFIFPQHTSVGNFNAIMPYAHELVHGLYLTGFLVWLWQRWDRNPRAAYGWAAGAALGLIVLIKLEVIVAAAALLLAVAVNETIRPREVRPAYGRTWLAMGAAAAGALSLFGFYFLARSDAATAFRALTAAPGTVFGLSVSESTFYQRIMGTDAPGEKIFPMLGYATAVVGVAAAMLALDWGLKGVQRYRPVLLTFLAVIVAAAFRTRVSDIDWQLLPQGFPLVVLAGVALALAERRRARHGQEDAPSGFFVVWGFVSLAFLMKMGLNVTLGHYGFVLALPATLFVVALWLDLLPRWARRWGGRGDVLKVIGCVALIFFASPWLDRSERWWWRKSQRLEVGGESFRIEPFDQNERSEYLVAALERVDRHLAPGETLMVLPEGVIVNYLTRLVNPTPYINFTPVELELYGETTILERMQKHAPDAMLLVPRQTWEYGTGPFGRDPDYGKSIVDWIEANYEAVGEAAPGPWAAQEEPEVRLLRRRPPG